MAGGDFPESAPEPLAADRPCHAADSLCLAVDPVAPPTVFLGTIVHHPYHLTMAMLAREPLSRPVSFGKVFGRSIDVS